MVLFGSTLSDLFHPISQAIFQTVGVAGFHPASFLWSSILPNSKDPNKALRTIGREMKTLYSLSSSLHSQKNRDTITIPSLEENHQQLGLNFPKSKTGWFPYVYLGIKLRFSNIRNDRSAFLKSH